MRPCAAQMYATGRMVCRTTSWIVRVVPTTKEADMTTTEAIRAVRRYPIAGVSAVLGVPRRDQHLFSRWASESLTTKTLDELYAYVDVMIADRCRQLGDDLLSDLIQMEVDGEELTVDDIRMLVAALVSGASV
jgi:cytochrome P450